MKLLWNGTFALALRTVIIGDSMFWSGPLFFGGQPSPLSKWLETWSGHRIENHALVGASLEQGWIKSIPDQFRDLNLNPTITTLVMDGGGNDVISHRSECQQWKPSCEIMIDNCVSLVVSLLEKAEAEKISHVLYLGFYYLPGLEKAADVANPRIAEGCANATMDCHFVDPRYNATSGEGLKTPEMLGPDGVHPTEAGYKILAQMIWDSAQQYNVTL